MIIVHRPQGNFTRVSQIKVYVPANTSRPCLTSSSSETSVFDLRHFVGSFRCKYPILSIAQSG